MMCYNNINPYSIAEKPENARGKIHADDRRSSLRYHAGALEGSVAVTGGRSHGRKPGQDGKGRGAGTVLRAVDPVGREAGRGSVGPGTGHARSVCAADE